MAQRRLPWWIWMLPIAAGFFWILFGRSLMSHWETVDLKIPMYHHTKALWWQGEVGLVMGEIVPSNSEDLAEVNKSIELHRAFIFRKEGVGRLQQVYLGKGTLTRVSQVGSSLYALGEYWSGGGQKRDSYLLKSTDMGKSWKDLSVTPEFFWGIQFIAGNHGFGWSEGHLYETQDDGSTWKQTYAFHAKFEGLYAQPVVDSQANVWIADGTDLVRWKSSEARSPMRLVLPRGIEFYDMALSPSHILFLIGTQGDKKALLYRLDGEAFRLVSEFPYFLPNHLHVGATVIAVAMADMGQPPNDVPRHYLMLSRDQGKTWIRETPATLARLDPIWFETDEQIWANGVFGQIQKRTP